MGEPKWGLFCEGFFWATKEEMESFVASFTQWAALGNQTVKELWAKAVPWMRSLEWGSPDLNDAAKEVLDGILGKDGCAELSEAEMLGLILLIFSCKTIHSKATGSVVAGARSKESVPFVCSVASQELRRCEQLSSFDAKGVDEFLEGMGDGRAAFVRLLTRSLDELPCSKHRELILWRGTVMSAGLRNRLWQFRAGHGLVIVPMSSCSLKRQVADAFMSLVTSERRCKVLFKLKTTDSHLAVGSACGPEDEVVLRLFFASFVEKVEEVGDVLVVHLVDWRYVLRKAIKVVYDGVDWVIFDGEEGGPKTWGDLTKVFRFTFASTEQLLGVTFSGQGKATEALPFAMWGSADFKCITAIPVPLTAEGPVSALLSVFIPGPKVFLSSAQDYEWQLVLYVGELLKLVGADSTVIQKLFEGYDTVAAASDDAYEMLGVGYKRGTKSNHLARFHDRRQALETFKKKFEDDRLAARMATFLGLLSGADVELAKVLDSALVEIKSGHTLRLADLRTLDGMLACGLDPPCNLALPKSSRKVGSWILSAWPLISVRTVHDWHGAGCQRVEGVALELKENGEGGQLKGLGTEEIVMMKKADTGGRQPGGVVRVGDEVYYERVGGLSVEDDKSVVWRDPVTVWLPGDSGAERKDSGSQVASQVRSSRAVVCNAVMSGGASNCHSSTRTLDGARALSKYEQIARAPFRPEVSVRLSWEEIQARAHAGQASLEENVVGMVCERVAQVSKASLRDVAVPAEVPNWVPEAVASVLLGAAGFHAKTELCSVILPGFGRSVVVRTKAVLGESVCAYIKKSGKLDASRFQPAAWGVSLVLATTGTSDFHLGNMCVVGESGLMLVDLRPIEKPEQPVILRAFCDLGAEGFLPDAFRDGENPFADAPGLEALQALFKRWLKDPQITLEKAAEAVRLEGVLRELRHVARKFVGPAASEFYTSLKLVEDLPSEGGRGEAVEKAALFRVAVALSALDDVGVFEPGVSLCCQSVLLNHALFFRVMEALGLCAVVEGGRMRFEEVPVAVGG